MRWTGSKVDRDTGLRNVVVVEVVLGCQVESLANGVLDQTGSAEWKESLGGVRTQDGFCSIEEPEWCCKGR